MISLSHNGDMLAVILGNPAMIEAYKSGFPATASLSRRRKNGEDPLEPEEK